MLAQDFGHLRQLSRMWVIGTLVKHNIPILQIYPLISSKVLSGAKSADFFSARKHCPTNLHADFGARFRTFALHKSQKKGSIFWTKPSTQKHTDIPPKGLEDLQDNFEEGNEGHCDTFHESRNNSSSNSSPLNPARNAVLKACAVTSGALLALGLLIREGSHIASMEGWPILDASTEVSFGLEMQHVQLTLGIVVLISSCRYMLLKSWTEFSESSEAANQQVLGSLQPLDYLMVAFLPGISEELLFRGALLPLLGLSWTSAVIVGAIFGGLHLGGGRRYSFAIWASFVGFVYGMVTVSSSSIIIPMACHALNNLVGVIIWRYESSSVKIGVDGAGHGNRTGGTTRGSGTRA